MIGRSLFYRKVSEVDRDHKVERRRKARCDDTVPQ